MTYIELQQRVSAVLNSIDRMSKNGDIAIKGIDAIQQMAGCIGVLTEILNTKELEVPEAEK